MAELVELETASGIATVTLSAPASYNVLSLAMMSELRGALAEVAADIECRVVILRARGKVFCAGHDLQEMVDASSHDDKGRALYERLFAECSAIMQTLVKMPQPVIAEVQGVATAAGCQLVASSDLAIAADEAKFGVNGVSIGLFCSTPMVALSRNITRKRAFEMLTTGDFLSAAEAAELGLINRAVPAEHLSSETTALAAKLAAKLPSALKIGKEAFYRQLEMPLRQAYEYTADVMVENMIERDTVEGVAAFLEKRTPDWKK